MSCRVLVTTIPFGDPDRRPRALLEDGGTAYDIQPFGRRITELELADIIAPYRVLIAGTEPITARVMAAAPSKRARTSNPITAAGTRPTGVKME